MRIAIPIIVLLLIVLFLAGCKHEREEIQCVHKGSGLVLSEVDVRLYNTQYGFRGTDGDGFQHVVPHATAHLWKCRIKPQGLGVDDDVVVSDETVNLDRR